jgi:fructosamine-3-kinase
VTGFEKRDPGAPPGFFEAEARGLRWLREGGAPVPDVLDVGPGSIVLTRIDVGPWTPAAEEAAGRAVATLHRAGAPCFGLAEGDGFIGPLAMANTPSDDWRRFYVECRVLPFLRQAVDRPGDARPVRRAFREPAIL